MKKMYAFVLAENYYFSLQETAQKVVVPKGTACAGAMILRKSDTYIGRVAFRDFMRKGGVGKKQKKKRGSKGVILVHVLSGSLKDIQVSKGGEKR